MIKKDANKILMSLDPDYKKCAACSKYFSKSKCLVLFRKHLGLMNIYHSLCVGCNFRRYKVKIRKDDQFLECYHKLN